MSAQLHCPGCREPVVGALKVQREGGGIGLQPGDGAAVLCSNCGHVGVVVAGPLGRFIREATLAELRVWAGDPAAQGLARTVMAARIEYLRRRDGG